MVTSQTITDTFIAEARSRLDHSIVTIKHCVAQLDDDQVWWRPGEAMNSIANLVLHLAGNMRQWLVSGVGGQPDVRQRAKEFSARGPMPRADLLRRLDGVVKEADQVMAGLSPSDLVQDRRIQGFDTKVLAAVFGALTHLQGHTQEIIQLTRQQLGSQYSYHWKPRTREEGAV